MNKCDEFIKKYLKERDLLRKTEFKYIIDKIKEQSNKGKRKYSDDDLNIESIEDKTKIIKEEEDKNNYDKFKRNKK